MSCTYYLKENEMKITTFTHCKSITKIIIWSGKTLSQNLRRLYWFWAMFRGPFLCPCLPLNTWIIWIQYHLSYCSIYFHDSSVKYVTRSQLILSQDVGRCGSFHFRQETTFQLPETVEDIDWDINSSSRHCHCCFNLVRSLKQVRIKKHRTTSGQKNPECLGMPPTTFSASLTQTDAAKNRRGIPEIRISPECFSWQGIVAACHFYECFLSRSNSLERPFWKQGL